MNQNQQGLNETKKVALTPTVYDVLWSKLARVVGDFSSDVEQIKFLLAQEKQHALPRDYKVNDAQIDDTFENAYKILKNKGDNDEAIFYGDGDSKFSISKKMIRFIIEEMKYIKLKNKRNENFLNIVSFTHLVSLFDAAILDIAEVMFREYPHTLLPIGKGVTIPSLNYVDILNAQSIDQLKHEMIQREIDSLGRESIRIQIEFFNKILGASFIDSKHAKVSIDLDKFFVASIIEIRETRNIHVHNRGIVNNQYHQKINEYYKIINSKIKDTNKHISFGSIHGCKWFSLGEYREITDTYINDAIWRCSTVLNELKNALLKKFVSQDLQDKLDKQNDEYWKQKIEIDKQYRNENHQNNTSSSISNA